MIRDVLNPPAIVVDAEVDALATYRAIEERITNADKDGIVMRWEFGRKLLAERERNGGKQLPHGRLAEVCADVGISATEARTRMQFAAEVPTRQEVTTLVATFPTWTEMRDQLGRRGRPEPISVDQPDIDPPAYPTLADVPWPGRIHPHLNWFPMMSWIELQRMANSIKDIGLIMPITITPDGTLLDGRQRLIACKLAGVEARFEVFTEGHHVSYRGSNEDLIWSSNMVRKHGESDLETLEERIRSALGDMRDICASLPLDIASRLLDLLKPMLEQVQSGAIERTDERLTMFVPSIVLASAEIMPDEVFNTTVALTLDAVLDGLAGAGR